MKDVKYQLIGLLSGLLLCIAGCNKSSEEINTWEQKSEIRVSVYYTSPDLRKKMVDGGSKLYVFYGITAPLHRGYIYLTNGLFRDSQGYQADILANDMKILPRLGTCAIEIKKDIDMALIVVESNRYKDIGRFAFVSEAGLMVSRSPRIHEVFFKESIPEKTSKSETPE